jgi:hypothetical protein
LINNRHAWWCSRTQDGDGRGAHVSVEKFINIYAPRSFFMRTRCIEYMTTRWRACKLDELRGPKQITSCADGRTVLVLVRTGSQTSFQTRKTEKLFSSKIRIIVLSSRTCKNARVRRYYDKKKKNSSFFSFLLSSYRGQCFTIRAQKRININIPSYTHMYIHSCSVLN